MRLDELFAINGNVPPPVPPVQIVSPQVENHLVGVWRNNYARGFDRFFETTWFSQSGEQAVFPDQNLLWEFASFFDVVSDPMLVNGPTVHSQEARLIWRLAKLCQRQIVTPNGTTHAHSEEADITSRRLMVVEALLTGETLSSNPLPPSMHFSTQSMQTLDLLSQNHEREQEFWYCLGHFVSIPPGHDNAGAMSDALLGRARMVLDTFENRDVLYSIATVKNLGAQYADILNQESQVQSEGRVAYFVAKGFVESQVARGTNQISQRLCEMATRLWTD